MDKPLPKVPSQAQTKSITESQADKHAHDRALFLLANLTGNDASITLKNGEQFTGVFCGGSFEPNTKHQYILKMVKRTRLPSHQQINGNTELPDEYTGEGEDHVMVFDKEDTVELAADNVVTASAQPMQNGSIKSSFRTDTEISGRDRSMPRERELQRWDADANSAVDMSLESSGETGWDQFAINERMYGVQSTYDENIYTTAIDRSNPMYKQREADAARIAREIEGSAPANAHVAEERRRDLQRGDGMDEEEKYSGVKREPAILPKRAANAYVPPSQRPIANVPTIPGAPFDPAIISLAKPTPPPTVEKSAESAVVPKPVAPSETQTKEIATENVADVAVASGPVAESSKRTTEHTTEDHVRNAADSFKTFANNEKLKHKIAQEKRQKQIVTDKNVRLNDLKFFAKNFKLKSRVPDDLVPILAKDREKQIAIQHKADEAAKEAQVAEDKAKERPARDASPAPSTSSQATVNTAVESRLPLTQQQTPRARPTQNMRTGLPLQQSPRALVGQNTIQSNRAYNRQFPPPPQPLPSDLRIPTGPAISVDASAGPLSPTKPLNVQAPAFQFRPAVKSFTPSSPSPQTNRSSMDNSAVREADSFFEKDKELVTAKAEKDVDSTYNPVKRMATGEYTEEQKKAFEANGGMPQPYRTPPTWPHTKANENASYKDTLVEKSQGPSQVPSPKATPNSHTHMPHAHQLPQYLQGPQNSSPSHRPPYMPPQHHPGAHGQGFDPRMQQQFGPNGSVHSSPRFPQAQMAFGNQMQGMPMPQFGGQQMPGYGMSPSMQYRHVNMPQAGPMMMMPNQQHGQMAPMPQGYPRGPQQYHSQMMGGVPMMNQHSQGFMNGPMPHGQSYSPMPPHAQPHMPHMQPHGNHGGYSPRPHMMQHTASHQGFQPGMMQPPFAPSPGQPHPYHMQHRQMSAGGGYAQMTPRMQHTIPQQHPSPGMGVPSQGDEGK